MCTLIYNPCAFNASGDYCSIWLFIDHYKGNGLFVTVTLQGPDEKALSRISVLVFHFKRDRRGYCVFRTLCIQDNAVLGLCIVTIRDIYLLHSKC